MFESPVASCAAGLLPSVFDAVVNLLLVGEGVGGRGVVQGIRKEY